MGFIPTHGLLCRTRTYQVNCWYCGAPIWVLQCSCHSVVLFDSLGWPWPEHQCRSGIGGSGLSGWMAVDVLRANGVPIDASIMEKAFPPPELKARTTAKPVEQTVSVQPKASKQITLLAVIRELLTETKRTKSLGTLGPLGAKLLRLPKGQLWQATLVVNTERPNRAYTCMIPESLGLPRDCKDKMVFATLDARVAGDHAIWLVTDIQLIA